MCTLINFRKRQGGIAMDCIDRLRALREDNDLTQTEVANYLGTSQTMYARYARRASELPIRHLIKLCALYNISADYILSTQPNKRRAVGKAYLKTE